MPFCTVVRIRTLDRGRPCPRKKRTSDVTYNARSLGCHTRYCCRADGVDPYQGQPEKDRSVNRVGTGTKIAEVQHRSGRLQSFFVCLGVNRLMDLLPLMVNRRSVALAVSCKTLVPVWPRESLSDFGRQYFVVKLCSARRSPSWSSVSSTVN